MTHCLPSATRRTFFLFVLLAACCACGAVGADTKVAPAETPKKSVSLLLSHKTKVDLQPNGSKREPEVIPSIYDFPFFVATKSGIVAFAEAKYNFGSAPSTNRNTDPVSTYIEKATADWNEKEWKTQFVRQDTAGDIYFYTSSVGVTKNDKVYLLSVNRHINISSRNAPTEARKWTFRMSVGTVNNAEGKTMMWETSEALESSLEKLFENMSLSVDARARTGDFAFLTNAEDIVFIIRARKEDKDGYAVIHLNDTKSEDDKWECSYVATDDNCSSYFFPWGRGLTMLTQCKNGGYKVTASNDMGKNWTESVGLIGHMWDNLRDKSDFTTVTLKDNKTVVLFTEMREIAGTTQTGQKKYELHLLVTDGGRLYDAGPILSDVKGFSRGNLLYTDEMLFLLYMQLSYDNRTKVEIILVRVEDAMDRVKAEVTTWVAQDSLLSGKCAFAGVDGSVQLHDNCVPTPTIGLVGFMSNKTTESGDADNGVIWIDEYYFTNATVTKGVKVENGFRFSQPGAGAVWPVGKGKNYQFYNFANHGLTLVATVTIHNAAEKGRTSLMGVGLVGADEKKERVELLCGRDQRWKLAKGSVVATLSDASCLQEKQYQVTLVYRNGWCSVYVDTQLLGALEESVTGERDPDTVSHLYFGVDNNEGGSAEPRGGPVVGTNVTVTNVFLYNWPFSYSTVTRWAERRKAASNMSVVVEADVLESVESLFVEERQDVSTEVRNEGLLLRPRNSVAEKSDMLPFDGALAARADDMALLTLLGLLAVAAIC